LASLQLGQSIVPLVCITDQHKSTLNSLKNSFKVIQGHLRKAKQNRARQIDMSFVTSKKTLKGKLFKRARVISYN